MSEQKNEVPMMPKHQHQAEMMHMSWTIRWLVAGIVVGFICMLTMAYIFVSSYTSRTERWLKTYDELVNRFAVTEGTNEKDTSGVFQ